MNAIFSSPSFRCLLTAATITASGFLSGCQRDADSAPTPTVPTTTVSGTVLARDEVLQPLPSAGTIVALEGTDFKTTTDATGAFRLQKVPTGNYVLNVSRAGQGTMRYEAVVQAPNPLAFNPVTLDQYTSTKVTGAEAVGKASYSLPGEVAAYQCRISYNPQLYTQAKTYSMMVFIGKTDKVSNTDNVWNSQYSETESTPPPAVRGTATIRVDFHDTQLQRMGFASGDKVYVAFYGAPQNVAKGGIGNMAYYFEPYYRNPANATELKQVVANLQPNSVRVSFTMP